MIKYILLGFSFILVYVHKIGGNSDYYSSKWAMLLVLCCLVMAAYVWKKYHWSAGLVLGYFFINSINIFLNYANQYEGFHRINKLTVISSSSVALICCVLLFFLVDKIKEKDFETLDSFFVLVCIVDSVYVIIQAFTAEYWWGRGGLWANVGTNGVFISLLIPFLYASRLRCLVPLAAGACILCMSSVSVGTLVVVSAVLCFYYFKKKKWIRFIAPILLIASIFSFSALYDTKLFSSNFRTSLYAVYIAQWVSPVSYKDYKSKTEDKTLRMLKVIKEKTYQKVFRYSTGWGTGTHSFFGILAQDIYNVKWFGWARWAHSDWLQLFLEGGIIGLLLSLNLFFWVFWKARRDAILCAQVLGFGAAMVFLYPLHYPMHAFLMLYFIKKSFTESREFVEVGPYGDILPELIR